MRLSHLVISLPLLLSATPFTPLSIANAADLDAAQATELLAKSMTIDAKCGVLPSDQSQDLKDFLARAEISLAEKASVAKARKTIAGGKAAGKAVVCDDAANKLVNDVLAAANAAARQAIADETKHQPAAQTVPPAATQAIAAVEAEPILAPSVKVPMVKAVKPASAVKMAQISKSSKLAKPAKALGNYASVAEKYYVAARCGGMSRGRINALYRNVLANHQQALATNRPQEVRAMLRAAEARAGAKSCT